MIQCAHNRNMDVVCNDDHRASHQLLRAFGKPYNTYSASSTRHSLKIGGPRFRRQYESNSLAALALLLFPKRAATHLLQISRKRCCTTPA